MRSSRSLAYDRLQQEKESLINDIQELKKQSQDKALDCQRLGCQHAIKQAREVQLQTELDAALLLLKRCLDCFRKKHWEDGDTDNVVSEAVNGFLWDRGIEREEI